MSVLTYKLSNLLPTSLRIEDLGITLQAAGGRDSICTVSADSFERSSSVQEHLRKKWISAKPVPVGGTMPAWPASKPPAPPPAPAPAPAPGPDMSAIHAEMRTMNRNLEAILAVLKNGVVAVPAVAAAAPAPVVAAPAWHAPPAQVHAHAPASGPAEPFFIPSSIVPKDAETHIEVQEEQSTVEGFDDAAAALKAARKKK